MKKGFEPEEDEDLSPDEEMETTKYQLGCREGQISSPEMEMVTAAQNKNGKVFFEKKKEWDGV